MRKYTVFWKHMIIEIFELNFMHGRNEIFNLKFGFDLKFRVEWYACWYVFILILPKFFMKKKLRRRWIVILIKSHAKWLDKHWLSISFDSIFDSIYAESEYLDENFIPPTVFWENSIWKICVGYTEKLVHIHLGPLCLKITPRKVTNSSLDVVWFWYRQIPEFTILSVLTIRQWTCQLVYFGFSVN